MTITTRCACATLLTGLCWLGASSAHASTTYGSLGNFDVFNDSSTNSYYGFEIELEGINPTDIAHAGDVYYTFHNWHYGAGQVSGANGNTYVRYYDNGLHSTAPFTTPITDTGGHSCITIDGCEHFGLALNVNPTASRYYWLDQAGVRSTAVSLIAPPIVTVVQPVPAQPGVPAQPARVQFVVEAPEAPEVPELNQKFSDAVWVKVMKTELGDGNAAELDDLMADNPGKIADAADPNAVEVEWKLLQRDLRPDADPLKNILDSGEQEAGAGAEQVLRTYQYFGFTGTYSEEHEATCAAVGTCEDDLAADPNNVGLYVGNLIGQQMIAANLNGAIELPAAVPVPAAFWLFGSALAGLIGLSRRA
ncbi:MAG: VPLPA-CTERM sorting domain-containing protein [Candidatus Methylumidiphilus sp.]